MKKRCFLALLVFVVGACSSDTSGSAAVSVTGTYKGTLTQLMNGQTSTASITMVLTQTGASVTGTQSFDGDPSTATMTGTVSGSSLSLVAKSSQSSFDDCHLFPWTWNFNISGNDLVVSSVTGVDCIGDGKGGHAALNQIGTISGTMKKQ